MQAPAFVSSFCGAAVQVHTQATRIPSLYHAATTPRSSMSSDSVAPKIVIKDTKYEPTNSISVIYEKVYPSLAEASGVSSNAALAATLKRKYPSTPTPAPSSPSSSSKPTNVSPSDFYFPNDIRNQAPFIKLGADNSLSVAYDTVEAEVSGVSSDNSVPFWEKKTYKWAPSSSSSSVEENEENETLDTSLYEKYFPSDVRNRAPVINIVTGGYRKNSLTLSTEFVGFNPTLSRMLKLPELTTEDGSPVEDMPLNAAATIAKYFPADHANKAPKIVVDASDNAPSVSFCMEDVVVTEEEATKYNKT